MPIYQSASGYTGIEATPLARVGYSDFILSRVYEDDWLPRITSTELLEPVTRCFQEIQIMHAPEVAPMRPYVKNQQLVPSTVQTTARSLTINCMAYQDIKFDETDIKMACDRWAPFEEKLLESMYQSYVDSQRTYVLGRMISQVSPMTAYNDAGRNHDVDLGIPGQPVHVTPQNLPKVLADLPMKPAVKDEVIFSVMRMFIASGETDGREETYRTTLAMVQAESVKQRLGAFYEQDTRMRSDTGRVADFEVMTTDDARVWFSSVCEKPVIYIDIWSTWCAPCCREIPYVARLVELYKDNPDIEFVSLSIDQNVKNWKAFLAKADHTGWKQYLIPAEAQRAFMNAFAINGIPRFLVIGRDGKILDSNAPRPSSEGITEYLNKQIDKAAR